MLDLSQCSNLTPKDVQALATLQCEENGVMYKAALNWKPQTDHTTPTVIYSQSHLRVKRTYSVLTSSWQYDKWRGLTTELGEVVQGWSEPVQWWGCFLVSLVTILDRRTGKRSIAYLAIQYFNEES